MAGKDLEPRSPRPAASPILVTGVHRSGTTWIGEMLAAGAGTTLVFEPLSLWHRPGVMSAAPRYSYQYICRDNEREFHAAYQRILQLRYSFLDEVRAVRSPRGALRLGWRVVRDGVPMLKGRIQKSRPLIKDPFAVFSLEWFSRRLGCYVVVAVRHPAAHASSLKKRGTPFDLSNLLAQPLLMRDWLEPLRGRMEMATGPPGNLVEQAALLWLSIYSVVVTLRTRIPGIHVVRHEDLSRDPVGRFAELYALLGLAFTDRAASHIERFTSDANPPEIPPEGPASAPLDSRRNLGTWKARLTADEVAAVKGITAAVAPHFYSEEDWEH